jgi:hypothetical protein
MLLNSRILTKASYPTLGPGSTGGLIQLWRVELSDVFPAGVWFELAYFVSPFKNLPRR